MTTWVYFFGEGNKNDKALLGGKGAGLHEMTKLGLPIPSGFTISTRACIAYQKGKKWPEGLAEQVKANVASLEKKSGKRLGDPTKPLLVSVRSGAVASMPGMMDTVLNLGLNEKIVEGLASLTKNERFAYDAYRRFITMFADVVMGVQRMKFEHILDHVKKEKKIKLDTDLSTKDLKHISQEFLKLYKQEVGSPFPSDPEQQLTLAINAVFNSWDNPRAKTYRKLNKMSDDGGTAVNVQEMVFGNMGDDSATGVAFTRNPSTGQNKRFGEYLSNAQGEDVVAGIRTPHHLEHMKTAFPQCYKQLFEIFELLEKHYRDMQDIEFTIEKQKLFILQTRNGKRTAAAAVKIAVDMVKEGAITKREAILRVAPEQLESLMHKALDPNSKKKAKLLTKGLPASPGAAVGQIVFTAEAAVKAKEEGKKTILVRLETSPEDITGMAAAQGILTARGGMTSHAAVVARGMNVCCVAGCSEISVNEKEQRLSIGDNNYTVGDWFSLDGSTGEVFEGKLSVVDPQLAGEFEQILSFADEFRTLDIYANADTPHDAKVARSFGATGIGLVRTEHMFFNPKRIQAVREMILADNLKDREKALAKVLPYQREDFHGILEVMDGLPVIIRLIDPPLHEFLPHEDHEIKELAESLGVSFDKVKKKVVSMKEFNPMLGFRGCRLGIIYPEINAMQVRAIFEASVQLTNQGKKPHPLIEIPLVGELKEFLPLKKMVLEVAKATGAEGKVHYEVGTMIEVPRAALLADELAAEAQFMSFGTNDLTQMTCGFSRDDAASFLRDYVSKGLYGADPFQSIDQHGTGKLMQLCVRLARTTNPTIDFGICGEHAGDPASVEFCHRIRLNNVSPSPYRVPIARLAAAQAAIKYGTAPELPPVFKSKL
jgi:pyruvate,orthophosphate dikinase